MPAGWAVSRSADGMTLTLTSPDGRVRATYAFRAGRAGKAASASDLRDVRATVGGVPVDGFDWRGGTFAVGAGDVALTGVPDGWTVGHDGDLWTISRDGVDVSYRFVRRTAPASDAELSDTGVGGAPAMLAGLLAAVAAGVAALLSRRRA